MSRLERFILFHLFKVPTLVLVAAVVCGLAAGILQQKANRVLSLLDSRARLDLELIQYNSHFLSSSSTVESVLSAYQVPCRTLTNHPVRLELDYEAAKRLEKVGLLISEAASENGRLTVTLKDYPE